jgi:homoserine O-succinyltransferase
VTLRLIKPEAARREDPATGVDGSSHLTFAVINNMPDGAFDATERQFLSLLEEASEGHDIQVRRYTMPGVPRGETVLTRIAEEYLPLTDLFLDPPNLLIVTGSNPIEINIEDEPYWSDLVEVLSWAREHVCSTLLSCLSAHAAMTIFDRVDRTRLAEKCAGVFSHHVKLSHPLADGLEPEILLPHSRWNSVPREALEDAGYDVIIHSDVTGWTVASRDEDGRQMVLVQGHPEYDPSSLLREYRRDAGRYVRGERSEVPLLPFHCVSSQDWEALEQFHREIVLDQRDPTLFEEFAFEDMGARVPWPWRTLASRFFTNWVTSVVQEKD